jgi:hypothetical protein
MSCEEIFLGLTVLGRFICWSFGFCDFYFLQRRDWLQLNHAIVWVLEMGLESWKWGLGSWVLGLVGLELVTLVTGNIGSIGNRVHLGLESFCIPKQNTV